MFALLHLANLLFEFHQTFSLFAEEKERESECKSHRIVASIAGGYDVTSSLSQSLCSNSIELSVFNGEKNMAMTASEEMKTIDKYAERHKVTRKKNQHGTSPFSDVKQMPNHSSVQLKAAKRASESPISTKCRTLIFRIGLRTCCNISMIIHFYRCI